MKNYFKPLLLIFFISLSLQSCQEDEISKTFDHLQEFVFENNTKSNISIFLKINQNEYNVTRIFTRRGESSWPEWLNGELKIIKPSDRIDISIFHNDYFDDPFSPTFQEFLSLFDSLSIRVNDSIQYSKNDLFTSNYYTKIVKVSDTNEPNTTNKFIHIYEIN
jgi:hypothetical protein